MVEGEGGDGEGDGDGDELSDYNMDSHDGWSRCRCRDKGNGQRKRLRDAVEKAAKGSSIGKRLGNRFIFCKKADYGYDNSKGRLAQGFKVFC